MRCAEFEQQYPCGYNMDYCVGPPAPINTYFQGDEVHFFVELDSTDAKIIYSKIIDIWTTPTSTLDPLVPNDPNLYTAHLWEDDAALPLTWTNGATGLQENVDPVILETLDSNDFAAVYASQGTGDTDYGVFSGFQVLLDERIFPSPIDSSYDV